MTYFTLITGTCQQHFRDQYDAYVAFWQAAGQHQSARLVQVSPDGGTFTLATTAVA